MKKVLQRSAIIPIQRLGYATNVETGLSHALRGAFGERSRKPGLRAPTGRLPGPATVYATTWLFAPIGALADYYLEGYATPATFLTFLLYLTACIYNFKSVNLHWSNIEHHKSMFELNKTLDLGVCQAYSPLQNLSLWNPITPFLEKSIVSDILSKSFVSLNPNILLDYFCAKVTLFRVNSIK